MKITLTYSSSSSCHAIGMDIPDPFSPPLPIVHHFRLLYVGSSWSPCFCLAMWRGPQDYITYELVPTFPAVSCMSSSSNFDSFHSLSDILTKITWKYLNESKFIIKIFSCHFIDNVSGLKLIFKCFLCIVFIFIRLNYQLFGGSCNYILRFVSMLVEFVALKLCELLVEFVFWVLTFLSWQHSSFWHVVLFLTYSLQHQIISCCIRAKTEHNCPVN